VNPSGVEMAPLALALVALGGTWSLGSWLFGEDEDVPWWSLGAGLLAGGLTYGIGVAAGR